MDYRKALRKRNNVEEKEKEKEQEQPDWTSDSLSEDSDEDFVAAPRDRSTSRGKAAFSTAAKRSKPATVVSIADSTSASSFTSSSVSSSASSFTSSSASTAVSSSASSFTSSSASTAVSPSASSFTSSSAFTAVSSFTSSSVSSSASTSDSSAVSSSSSGRAPNRATLWRRKKREERDREVLLAPGSYMQEDLAGPLTCDICGGLRHMQDGHGYFRGQFFCALGDGPNGRTVHEWVQEQIAGEEYQIPKTTLWRMKRKVMAEESDNDQEEAEAGSKKRKPYKLRICGLCGQPAQKDYGHSQHVSGGTKVFFCALYHGISVELWLAQQRAKK